MPTQYDIDSVLTIWHVALLLLPALAAGAAALHARRGATIAAAWCGARWASSVALGSALLSLAAVLAGSTGSGHGVRADFIGGTMALLAAFVGWVIVRYSQTYLDGEPEARLYVRWLMATLTSIGVVVATNNALILALAWMATSLSIHRLLPFFGHRSASVIAAHKKFVVGRVADVCMLAAAGLLYVAFGTLQMDRIAEAVQQSSQLSLPIPLAAQVSIVLIAFAALLKCAQLPFHGWLIQVMEAPTPVSALLHAGVVNLGGFVLLRFAPLVSEVPAAQLLLVVVGTATAVLAALVMTTRISVKVMLAWSTCAQMGFMLLECGLGLWEIALLHLVAHSLYKAHAFLSAGGAVRMAALAQLTPDAKPPTAKALALGAVLSAGMTFAAGTVFGMLKPSHAASPALWVMVGILGMAIVPLVHSRALRLGGLWMLALALSAFGVAFAYFGLHSLFALWVAPSTGQTLQLLWLVVALAFGALFLLQSAIAVSPQGPLARSLYPWFYGGLFIDEKFSGIAFGLWPPPKPVAARSALPNPDTSIAFDHVDTLTGARK